jgi:hypothetical protein
MKKSLLTLLTLSLAFMAQSQNWSLLGNNGTNPATNFVGTKDNNPLKFRINNQYAGEIDSASTKTFFGYGAGRNTSTGIHNVAAGFKTLNLNTTGSFNTAIGSQALFSNTTGFNNTANGFFSLYSNTTGIYNTANGSHALYSSTTGRENTANGYTALYNNTTGDYNTATGANTLAFNTTGYENTATGSYALHNNTTGYNNTANGTHALTSNTTGIYNTANGTRALYFNTTGNRNSANGTDALHANTTGYDNTATGYNALFASINGAFNSANGSYALVNNTAGSHNTAFGYAALQYNTTASYNTCVGSVAGWQYATGYGNTLIGAYTDITAAGQYNSMAIGYNAIVNASNKVRIGNTFVNSIGGQVGWTTFSDGRYKQNIQEDIPGIAFISKLRPVSYTVDIKSLNENYYKLKANNSNAIYPAERQTGFIAQEVENTALELGFLFSGIDKPRTENGLYGLRYAEFVVPLVKAVQEQQQIINDLQKRITELERKQNNSFSSGNSNNTLNVWPNPSNDKIFITIDADSKSQAMIKIVDAKGALVKQQQATLLQGGNQLSADVKELAGGTYHVSVEWNNGQMKKTLQVIKQ